MCGKKSFIFLLFVLLVYSWCFSAEPLIGEKTVILEDSVNEALKNNPEIKVAGGRWEAAKEKIPQARSLPDPKFGYTYFGESIETRDGPQESAYNLSQKFPSFGKLSLRGEVANKQAKVAEEQYRATEREIIARVKKAYYELYWVHKAIEITEEIKELLEKFEKIAETRYSTGKGYQQSVLRAQLEVSRLDDKLLTLKQMKTTVVAMLNTLMNRSPEAPLGRPEDFETSRMPHKLDELYRSGEKKR